jgi:hypothetical protein
VTLSIRLVPLLTLLLVAAPRAWADVELKPEERENLGIQTESVNAVETGRQWSASAQVLDATPLITTLGELHAAEVAAVASKAEAERSERLYREQANVARKALDAAQAQAVADTVKLSTSRAQLLGTWGPGIASLSDDARSTLVAELLAGRTCLARIDLVQSLPIAVTDPHVELRSLEGGKPLAARWLGRLPQAGNATFAGAGLLRVGASLPAGSLLQGVLSEPSVSIKGTSVPVRAVIRFHGREWVYEESPANHFVMRQVRSGVRVDGRALLVDTLGPEAKVVTVGARAVLAAELGASSPQEAEGDDD